MRIPDTAQVDAVFSEAYASIEQGLCYDEVGDWLSVKFWKFQEKIAKNIIFLGKHVGDVRERNEFDQGRRENEAREEEWNVENVAGSEDQCWA